MRTMFSQEKDKIMIAVKHVGKKLKKSMRKINVKKDKEIKELKLELEKAHKLLSINKEKEEKGTLQIISYINSKGYISDSTQKA